MIIPFKHPNLQHPLYLSETEEITGFGINCDAFWEKIEDKLLFRCSLCFIYLDIVCATLPVVVSNRVDPHPLNLTFVEEQRGDEYYCDICEEERELGQWFYSCGRCSFAVHPRCVVGEFPYVKSAMHESHKHPLSLVRKKLGKEVDSGSNYAFQCRSSCNFSVDAMETSYNVTNHNVFYRACQPYERHIGDRTVIVGPFGQTLEIHTTWKKCVFSRIRAFAFCHRQYAIESIELKYEKNGATVWSKSGEVVKDSEEDKKAISFDYPDEYLVSIYSSFNPLSPKRFISSLTLQTNRKTYGPYGDETEGKFSSEKEGVKIHGIFGTWDEGDRIWSIGFYGVGSEE